MKNLLINIGKKSKKAFGKQVSSKKKDKILKDYYQLIKKNKKLIINENSKDIKVAKIKGLKDNLLKKDSKKDFIYIGCQILNRTLFENYKVSSFSITEIWNELLKKNELNGFESYNKFYHLTDLETFNKLKDF